MPVYRHHWSRRGQLRHAWIGTAAVVAGAFVVPTATASVQAVAPALNVSFAVPTATATVANVAPSIGVSYTTPAATATVAVIVPALGASYTNPASVATVSVVAPGLGVSFGVSAATGSVASVDPGLAASFAVPAGAASVGVSAVFAVTFAVPTMTADESVAFAPTLAITYTVAVMEASAAMVVPDFTTGDVVVVTPRVRGVGNGVIQVWQLEEETRPSYVYLTPTMQATARLNRPQLVISELPMDEDLSLLLELALV